jgi:phage/plasmid-like protein (TIGR03299 family)
MSQETTAWLNTNILRGFTEKRGRAWHYSAAHQGAEPNHYPAGIPVDDLHRRLFGWEAQPREVYVADPGYVATVDLDGVQVEDPSAPLGVRKVAGNVAWVRSDTGDVLGIHGDGYKGHQYGEWLVSNVAKLIGDGMEAASAGLLKGGAVAWVQIERPDNVEAPEGIVIRPFIMATTSFDGSIATTIQDGFTDTVCDNTRASFLAENGNRYRVKHTSLSRFNVEAARAALGIRLDRATDTYLSEITRLVNIDVSDKVWGAFVEAHAPIADDTSKRGITIAENKREALTRMWNTDVRVSPWRGTAWGVVQAVNTFVQHEGTVRNVNRVERNMMRAVTGGVATLDRETIGTLDAVMGGRILAPVG